MSDFFTERESHSPFDDLDAKIRQIVEEVQANGEDAGGDQLLLPRLRKPVLEECKNAYPFGPRHNFGISINGAIVTIYRSVVYRGGFGISVAQDTVTIGADGGWIVLKVSPRGTPETDAHTYALVVADITQPPDDADGYLIRGLHHFVLVDSIAQLDFSLGFDGDIGMMGY
jgi:hypothetical protein